MSVHELFPYLRVHGAADAITFYTRAFGATEIFRLVDPEDGRIGHAELKLGPATLMLSDAYPEYGAPAPTGPTGADLHLHVDDADATIQRALDAGATLVRPATDQFYGERSGRVRDPFGHTWSIGHSIEDVTYAEMQARWDAMAQGTPSASAATKEGTMSDDKPMRAELDKLLEDLKILRDEVRLQIHLGSADAVTAWKEDLEPKLANVEARATEVGQQALEAASRLAADVKKAVLEFRDRLKT